MGELDERHYRELDRHADLIVNTYTERQEGPDGQYCVLLTRVPYDRWLLIEAESHRDRNPATFTDVIFRALLEEASVKNYLTGEDDFDVARADPALVTKWRERAFELYFEWKKAAMPGPKGTSGTGSRTRTTKAKASGTSESA